MVYLVANCIDRISALLLLVLHVITYISLVNSTDGFAHHSLLLRHYA